MNLFDRIRDLKEKAAKATPEPVDTIVKGDVNASGVQIWHMKGRPCFESQAKHDVEYYSICSPDLITELCTALEEARELAEFYSGGWRSVTDGQRQLVTFTKDDYHYTEEAIKCGGEKARTFLEKWGKE